MEKYDFSGWATRNNLKCSDGRTIRKNAFKENDGQIVPLVWNHQHDDPLNVLGHALLENREEGVYTYGVFNNTEAGRNAKLLVEHGDVDALSIYANKLKQQGGDVLHGAIREVSLVLAGANPGAFIDAVMAHGEEAEGEAIIYTGEELSLAHAEKKEESPTQTNASQNGEQKENKEEHKMAEQNTNTNTKKGGDEETVADVFNTLNEKQKTVLYAMIGHALEEKGNGDDTEENETMKHNVFENDTEHPANVISHSDMEAIITDAKRYGSMKDSALAHGIENIEYLFPEAQNLDATPQFIRRDTGWVNKFMGAVHHTPFSRIKSMFADITEDDARAKGYIKGNFKAEEVFGLLKRTTTPTTVYKKQKIDRDDVNDISDFDVVAMLKGEMRWMLDEELVRAALVGDGRSASSDDKINEQNIRPIWKDSDLFTIKAKVGVAASATDDDKAKAFIRAAVKARKDYKGSGEPTLYITEDLLSDLLLLTDSIGRDLYDDVAQLAKKLRVKEIVTVPVLENLTRTDSDSKTRTLMGIIVNPADYNIGADKGGAVNMFDDFDIDYNAQKYLIETRCSGALTKPYSAIAMEQVTD